MEREPGTHCLHMHHILCKHFRKTFGNSYVHVGTNHGDSMHVLSQTWHWYTPWQAVTKTSADFVLAQ